MTSIITDDFTEIVRSHETKVRGLCASFVGFSQADDAAQEVFIKAYQSLASFKGESKFSTWLYRIAVNHCKDLLRKRSREKTESLDALIEAEGEKLEQFFSTTPDPRNVFESRELTEKILSSLRPNYRLILTLREADGLSYEEISGVLGCSLDSVKAQLRRAREEAEEKLRHFVTRSNV